MSTEQTEVAVTTTPDRKGILSGGGLRVAVVALIILVLAGFLLYGWISSARTQQGPRSSVSPLADQGVDATPAITPDPDARRLLEQEARSVEANTGLSDGQTRAAVPPLLADPDAATAGVQTDATGAAQPQYTYTPPPPPPPTTETLLAAAQNVRNVRAALGPHGAHGTLVNNAIPPPAAPATNATASATQAQLDLPVGAILRARLEIGVNTDYPTDVTARVLSTEGRDLVLVGRLGSAANQFARDRVLLQFSSAYRPEAPNTPITIRAIAVDPASRIPALKGRTNRHLIENTVFYLGGNFTEAYANALAQRYAQTGTTLLNNQVLESQTNIDPGRAGAASALGSLSFGRRSIRPPTVQIPAGTLIGIAILASEEEPLPASAPVPVSPYVTDPLANPAMPVIPQ